MTTKNTSADKDRKALEKVSKWVDWVDSYVAKGNEGENGERPKIPPGLIETQEILSHRS